MLQQGQLFVRLQYGRAARAAWSLTRCVLPRNPCLYCEMALATSSSLAEMLTMVPLFGRAAMSLLLAVTIVAAQPRDIAPETWAEGILPRECPDTKLGRTLNDSRSRDMATSKGEEGGLDKVGAVHVTTALITLVVCQGGIQRTLQVTI